MEKFEAECQEKVHNVEAELISLRKHVRECTITITTYQYLNTYVSLCVGESKGKAGIQVKCILRKLCT